MGAPGVRPLHLQRGVWEGRQRQAPTQLTKGHKVKGIPVFVRKYERRQRTKLIERSVWWAIARLATSLQWYFPKGGDAHVEGELARIVCLLPCRFVRQE